MKIDARIAAKMWDLEQVLIELAEYGIKILAEEQASPDAKETDLELLIDQETAKLYDVVEGSMEAFGKQGKLSLQEETYASIVSARRVLQKFSSDIRAALDYLENEAWNMLPDEEEDE